MNLIKKVAITSSAVALMLGSLAGSAFASSSGNGSDYGMQPGYSTAITNSGGCAGAGAFDAFGKGYNLGNFTSGHFSGGGNDVNDNGANGQQTGANNSNLCGNPQGNP